MNEPKLFIVMKRKFYTFLILSVAVVLGLTSCSDEFSGGGSDSATLVVKLTDAPADYEEVLIDVQELQIHTSPGEDLGQGSWINLPVNKGIYNLLDLRNGMDTLLATVEMPAGNISQMRLVLGDNNRLKVNGQYHNLETPSAQQSGLKFNINAQLEDGVEYELWIDFDAARSIVARGNGTYGLKPVIRTFHEASTGAIKGLVLPLEAKPTVKAIVGTDTLATIPSDEGKFMFKGLAPGSYKVEIEPIAGFESKIIENREVIVGKVTDLGTITLEGATQSTQQ
jgi:hypothetical protein